MNPKAEFALISCFSLLLPIAVYLFVDNLYAKSYANTGSMALALAREDSRLEDAKILFVGDIMLDRTIRKDGESQGYEELFSCLPDMLSGYDEVIGNLEGTVTSNASVSRDAAYEAPESFRFTFDVSAVQALKDAGLSIVSIANNHIRDFGDDGISQTVTNLYNLGIPHFGDPRKGGVRYIVQDIKGTKVAFVGHNQLFGTQEDTLSALNEAQKQSDLQVVFPHWGDEYVPVRPDVRQLAHSFADAGADLVIGAHPHVIQEDEVYAGVPIYYSLGNFVFDQYWEPAVSTGMMVEMHIKEGKFEPGKKIFVESRRHGGTCLK